MSAWREQVDQLLYDGETVEDAVEWESAAVVVTSHRVLAFTPEMEGANFSQVDRPNVEGVEAGARAKSDLLGRGVRYLVIGLLLLGTGWLVDFGSLLGGVSLGDTGAAGELGMGGITGTVGKLLALIRQLDDLLFVLGVLGVVLAVVVLAVYWYTREETLTIGVAGGEDIHVPEPDEGATTRLEGLLGQRSGSRGLDDLL